MVHNALCMPAFGALVWSVAHADGAVARTLGARPLYRLGRASYDIYILQMPLMYLVLAARLPLAGARFFVVFGLLVYAVGLVFHLTIEARAQRWLAELFAVKNASPTIRLNDAASTTN
jgi:peptidoglycan/LPS O-acetylase OafA/YrhL